MTNLRYSESSDYGQEILDLVATLAFLMDDERLYTKKEIRRALAQARGIIQTIEEHIPSDGYFEPTERISSADSQILCESACYSSEFIYFNTVKPYGAALRPCDKSRAISERRGRSAVRLAEGMTPIMERTQNGRRNTNIEIRSGPRRWRSGLLRHTEGQEEGQDPDARSLQGHVHGGLPRRGPSHAGASGALRPGGGGALDPDKDPSNPPEPKESDLLAQIRQEMQEQFAAFKTETEAVLEAQKAQIAQLEADKASLQAALVKSATSPPPVKEPEKTEEDLYREKVEALAEKGLELMKRRLTE